MASSEKPWALAIDTSAITASVAVVPIGLDTGDAGAELLWKAGRNHTATLLSQIDALFRLCGIESGDVGAVAVTVGPGSFNALRVGISTAKAFSFAEDVPIFGVGTLDAAAFAFNEWGKPVRAFVDAGRTRVVMADYRPTPDGLVRRSELVHRTRPELADELIEPTILAGELPEPDAHELARAELVILPPPSVRRRRASILVDIIYPRWLAGDADDLIRLEPIYVHSTSRKPATGKRAT